MSNAILLVHEAVHLGHPLVAQVAADAGVRVLFIKGPALTAQGLRGAHESSDVDALVAPDDRDGLVAAMVQIGWHLGPISSAAKILPAHSVTLRHPNWPIEIDLHDRFPGFLADPSMVFEQLWERRTSLDMAGVGVAVPDVVGHAALVALHYLRDPGRGSAASNIADLATRVRDRFTADQLVELANVAAGCGAADTLRSFLDDVNAPEVGVGTSPPEELATWQLRIGSAGSLPWLVELGRNPLWRWPRLVWHAVMLSDEEMLAFHSTPGDERSVRQLRWDRLLRGIRLLPTTLTALARSRRR